MKGNVHITWFQSTNVGLCRHPVSYAKQSVCSNVRSHHGGKRKRQSAAEELLQNALPVPVRSDPGFVVRLKHFVVSGNGNNVEVFPYLLPFRRCQCFDGFVFTRFRAGQVFEEHVRKVRGDVFYLSPLRLNTKRFRRLFNLVFPDDGDVEFAFCRPLQRENDFSGMHTVLGNTSRCHSEKVPGNNEVCIGSADTAGRLWCNFTGTHSANPAADTGLSEGTLRFLCIEPVKGGFHAELFEV